MKVNLICKSENRERLAEMLAQGGFELSDDAPMTLYENDSIMRTLVAKSGSDTVFLDVKNVVMLESFGHDIYVYDDSRVLRIRERIYMLEDMLPPDMFIRISQSVIINRSKIKRIVATIGMRFILVMANDKEVTVTRSYNKRFRDAFGI